MQYQIKQLSSEIAKLKATKICDKPISSGKIQEATIQTIPTPPATYSPREHRLLPRNNVISTLQNPKNLQVASAENRGVTKSELQEVIHLFKTQCK